MTTPDEDRPVLALDLGATWMAAALVDSQGRIAASGRWPTPKGRDVDAEQLWRHVLGLVEQVGVRNGNLPELAGVGVGCAGPMEWPAGIVSPLNIHAWRGFDLRGRLREHFPGLPVRVHNGSACVAVGEHWRGSGRGTGNVMALQMSTGVGGGLVLGGRLIDGASGNAGHIGHVVVDPEGPPCTCGGRGCLEAVASGPALLPWAKEHGWHPGTEATVSGLAADASRGHPAAVEALARAGRALGVAVASATHLLDLEVVAVGGGMSQAGQLLFTPLEESFRRHARMDYAREVRVVPVGLGQESGLVGAAALVLAGDRYWSAG
jgi:glucokinase